MAPQKSPAFQFYAKDFLAGTATMSLVERGAYVTLLAYEWDSGSVPDSPRDRARILGCTAAQERAVWSALVKKFALRGDAYINDRLEEERQKQAEYRRRQSDKGKASAATRKQPEGNHGSTTVESRLQPEGNQRGNRNSTLLSSSSSSVKDHNTHSARANGHGNGANAPNALPRDHRYHAVCSSGMRVCLTEATAAKLAEKWGGVPDEALSHLREFCDWLEQRIGDGPKGDQLWLIQHFEAFMVEKDRVPVAPPPKPKPVKDAGVSAAIDAWGRE